MSNMQPTINYKTNGYFTGYTPWAYYGDNALGNVIGNPANNAVKKNSKDKLIDAELNYQYQEKGYESIEPDKINIMNANAWWGQHYFGATTILLSQDQYNYGATGNQKDKYQETEGKYSMSYAFPLLDNYIALGSSLNLNEKTVGFGTQELFSRYSFDLGISVTNFKTKDFGFGIGLKNFSYGQSYNNIEYMPDSSWGAGISYLFDNNIYAAADYNQYFHTDLFNTSLRGKYEFTSSYLNITPELSYMLNNNIFGEYNQQLGLNLEIGKDFRIDRTIQEPYEVPVLVSFDYDYQELNVSETTIPLLFKQVTITKEFSKSNQNWELTVSAPPINKIPEGVKEINCVFEITNDTGRIFSFTKEADIKNPKKSISFTAELPAGKYQVTSYYTDHDHNVISQVYADPDAKLIGICYTVKEHIVPSELAVSRRNANAIYDLQDEYKAIYKDYSECFDYIQTDKEIQKKDDAYGAINVIYTYLDSNENLRNQISENNIKIGVLNDQAGKYKLQGEALSAKIGLEDNAENNSYINQQREAERLYRETLGKIPPLEYENQKNLERIESNNSEIKNMLANVNRINIIPELMGLAPEEQIQVMIKYRPLYQEKHAELKEQKMRGLRLDKVSSMNNDFYLLYGRSTEILKKMIRTDLLSQNNNSNIDPFVDTILQQNNLISRQKYDINNMQFGEKVVFLFPCHDTKKSKWIDKKGHLELSYNKTDQLKQEEYPTFIERHENLRGDKRLKPESDISYNVKKYETRYKSVYRPIDINFYVNAGYYFNYGTGRTQDISGQVGLTVRGL